MFTGAASGESGVQIEQYEAEESVVINSHTGKILKTSVALSVPVGDKQDEKYVSLYRAYSGFLFDTDTVEEVNAAELPDKVLSYIRNRFADIDAPRYQEGDSTNSYEDSVDIDYVLTTAVIYNENNIFSLCKTVDTKYMAGDSIQEKYYFNYDIAHGKVIDIYSLFGEENIEPLTSLLRRQLMEQNKVHSEQQLYDMGFFNLDNMMLSGNFTFTRTGVMWVYRPLELGCYALGNVQIELPYSELLPYTISDEIDMSKL